MTKVTNIFISQPMSGLSDEQIEDIRLEIINKARKLFGDINVIDSYCKENFDQFEGNNKAIAFLGYSISKLAEADVAFFADEWYEARGCRIEFLVCEEYGIPIYQYDGVGFYLLTSDDED